MKNKNKETLHLSEYEKELTEELNKIEHIKKTGKPIFQNNNCEYYKLDGEYYCVSSDRVLRDSGDYWCIKETIESVNKAKIETIEELQEDIEAIENNIAYELMKLREHQKKICELEFLEIKG